MATTTFATIRDNYYTLIAAITPTVRTTDGYVFRKPPRRSMLRDWALTVGTEAVFRKFEISRSGSAADQLPHFDSDALQRRERARVTVAYHTAVAFYGEDEIDEMDDVMRSDARQIRDVLFDTGNYVSGQNAAIVTILPPDRARRGVWFQEFDVDFIYNEAQSL